MSEYGHVAVLMGGWSEERPISLISGQCACEALQAHGVRATAVDVQRDTLPDLSEQGFTHCFMALHGTGGEDGEVQQVLDELGLPYSGSGAQASRLCMDKLATKQLWSRRQLPTPQAVRADMDRLDAQVEELGLPLVAKPVSQGSSIGVVFVRQPEEARAAVEESMRHDSTVMLERLVQGTEYTVGILREEALPMIRLRPGNEFFDYRAKYESEETGYDIPCGLPEAMENEIRKLALQAFECTGARGYGRVDLIVDEWDRPWLLEVNTAPGLTHHSLLPMAAHAVGLDYADLILRMLATAVAPEPMAEAVHD